jgi:hypothetical protein
MERRAQYRGGMKRRSPRWLSRQQTEDVVHAQAYLGLLFAPRDAALLARRLEKSSVAMHAAKDIIRAARLTTLPASNRRVAEDLKKIARGKKIPPILLVRGDASRDLPLIVADGMHRLSAAWLVDESADIACCLVGRPKR